RKSRRATCRSLVHPDATILALQQTDRGSRFCPTSSSPAPPLNPHSARRTAAELPTAISCLGAFPTPAARASGLIRDRRRPKTCTSTDSRDAQKGTLNGSIPHCSETLQCAAPFATSESTKNTCPEL